MCNSWQSGFKKAFLVLCVSLIGFTAQAQCAMCRAALEMVLKRHYGKDAWDDLKLADIIALASRRYGSIPDRQLLRLNRDANKILHNYSARNRMSEKDERTILEFIGAVKFLIQRAPNPGV